MKNTVLTLALFLPVLTFAQGDPTVAQVNGEVIKKSDLDYSYRQSKLFLSRNKITKESVLNDLINRRIGVQLAYKNNLDKLPEVRKKMQDILYHAQVSRDVEPAIKKIKVSSDDIKRFYEKNPEYHTAHILFRLRAVPTVDEIKNAEAQINKIYKELQKDPTKFRQLANKYSQSSVAPNGGDLGFQPVSRLAPEYYEAIRGKKPGFISEPVRTQFGLHIVQVKNVKKYKDINTRLYTKIVYDIKKEKLIEEYFAKQRNKAKVKVYKRNL